MVGFRRGGLPEVVEDGVTAILVAPGDVAGAAAGVGRADQLSRGACRRHAEETLDLEATLDGPRAGLPAGAELPRVRPAQAAATWLRPASLAT